MRVCSSDDWQVGESQQTFVKRATLSRQIKSAFLWGETSERACVYLSSLFANAQRTVMTNTFALN